MEKSYSEKLINASRVLGETINATSSFYKYLDIDGGRKALMNNSIQFSRPTSFEDITECRSSRIKTKLGDILDRASFFSKTIINNWFDVVKISKRISHGVDINKSINDNLV